MLERLEDLRLWAWMGLIMALVALYLFAYYVPVAQNMRKQREKRIEQVVRDMQIMPLMQTKQMWRDYADRATRRGEVDLANYYNRKANEIKEF